MGKLYLITGDDDFAIKTKAKDVVEKICGTPLDNNQELEIIKGDSDERTPNEILVSLVGTLKTPPFLNPQKIVWLRHFIYFDKVLTGTATSRKGKPIEGLTEFIKDGIPDDVTLIIDGVKIKKNTALYKACDKLGTVYLFEEIKLGDKAYAQKLSTFLKELIAKNNKTIDYQAITYLVNALPSDRGRLVCEMEKLFCFLGNENSITINNCKEIISITPEALGYSFQEALLEQNTQKSLNIINTLMEQKRNEKGASTASELSLIASAINKFQGLIDTKMEMNEFDIPSNIGSNYFQNKELKLRFPKCSLFSKHPFAAYMQVQNAKKFTASKLSRILTEILKMNQLIVSGQINSRIGLEQMVIKITKKG